MKLSEAIMLGASVPGRQFDAMNWECCLLGLANRSVGVTNAIDFLPQHSTIRWPWITRKEINPPISDYAGVEGTITQILTGIALNIQKGNATLEQAVDWVKSVEPQDEPITTSLTAPLETALPVQG